jgi:hypothetical protein
MGNMKLVQNFYSVDYFDIVEEFPIGTPRVFTIPHISHFDKGQTEFSPANRVYLDPLTWPVIVVFKNIHTSAGVSNLMRLHMRPGHFNVQKLKLGCELYKTDYKDQIKLTDKLYCCSCSMTKARRNTLSRNPHRIIKSTAARSKGVTHQ